MFKPPLWHAIVMGMSLTAGAALNMHAGHADELRIGETTEQIPLTDGKPFIHVIHEDKSIKVQRVQNRDFELQGYWAKTVRKCPPFCLKPVSAAPGVKTVAEVEMFQFMENELRDGSGLLIDARMPAWHQKGTIPGSINIPFSVFDKEEDSLEVAEALELFGVKPRDASQDGLVARTLQAWGLKNASAKTEHWDFTDAKQLVLWCNGPHCGQSPRAIRGLIKLGYPADKLNYYRGGMQAWQLWGLTTVVPDNGEQVAVTQAAH